MTFKRLFLYFIASLVIYGCAVRDDAPSLAGGWKLQSLQMGDTVIRPPGTYRYFFKDDGSVVISSMSHHINFNYETDYGLTRVSNKWLLVIHRPFGEISVSGDTVTSYQVCEIMEANPQRLVWRFVTSGPCRDSSTMLPCDLYRTEFLERLDWDPTGLNDTIPVPGA